MVVVVVAMVVVAPVDVTNTVGGGELDTGTTREDPLSLTLVPAMAEVVVAVTLDEVALVMADELCATCSLDCFLAAALVCQPQEHGCSFCLSEEKNDPF